MNAICLCLVSEGLYTCDTVDKDLPTRQLLLQLSDLSFLVTIRNHELWKGRRRSRSYRDNNSIRTF